jgi:hypothetical protein
LPWKAELFQEERKRYYLVVRKVKEAVGRSSVVEEVALVCEVHAQSTECVRQVLVDGGPESIAGFEVAS